MTEPSEHVAEIARAAAALNAATALLVTAGAGMGVDSGLPDFRGNEGFWKAYPPYRKLGLSFIELANPDWFKNDPAFAWGFYGHRRNLYKKTTPHGGFAILKEWGRAMKDGHFVFTSNVDGQFQLAGFEPARVLECHGSIEWMQCSSFCGVGIFPGGPKDVPLNEETFRAAEPLPRCPRCDALARPNLLMFGDDDWDSSRTDEQNARMDAWIASLFARPDARVVIVECGAGTAIPTVREQSERIAASTKGVLVRINVREPEVPRGGGHVSLPMGALEALRAIDAARVSA